MKKATLATVKSFIRRELRNRNLYIKKLSAFNGMIDCVENVKDDFSFVSALNYDETNKYSLGIPGVWFVNGSRDYTTPYADDAFIGYEVYNSCGSFVVAMKKIY